MKSFRPQLERFEDRCTPSGICVGDSCALMAPLGHGPVLLTVTATTATLTVPNGHIVETPPSPIVPPSPCQQAVLAFLESNGQVPPAPIIPAPAGLFVAAGWVTPSSL
jgi:hypothetical protein